ncbi:MAG: hypothetical protein H6706_04760 [Myxococcales bacterium]|nr:hypothetical protein [Myxococcales bacterium]
MGLIRQYGALVALGALFSFGGCTEQVEDINRVQPNALKKDLFSGEWYFARTVIDVPYEADGTFVGDRQEYFFSEDFPALRVRWRIEEDRLLACRVDEIVLNGNDTPGRTEGDEKDPTNAESRAAADADGAGFEKFPCDHPVAAFRIQGHFDIQRQYNSSTGEQSNVISENSSDRPWYERDYIRVDWADLGLTDLGYNLNSARDMGWIGGIEAPYYVQEEGSNCERNADGSIDLKTCDEGFLPPVIDDETILITNRMTIVPPDGLFTCFITSYYGYGTPCTLSEIGMRMSFAKVPERAMGPHPEMYEPIYYPDETFERFGVWRVVKGVYTPGRGETDFQQYLGTRWKMFKETHRCNGDECTPLPLSEREINPIVYYLNREFPVDLKPIAFKMAKEWNDAYNGIKPGLDLTTSCKVECAGGKSVDQCSATDPDWKMTGTCAFELRENDGTKFMGDLRYNFISFIEEAGSGQPCGVGGPANDPETGELINATAYVYGNGCFDYIENTVMDMVDILCAQKARDGVSPLPNACRGIDENQFLRGLNILEIMQAQGYKQPPRTPIRGLTGGAGTDGAARRLDDMRIRMEEIDHHAGSLHTRRLVAEQAGLDRVLIPDELAREVSGGLARNAAELTDEQVKLANPFGPPGSATKSITDRIDHLAARAVEPADYLFNDGGLWQFAQTHMQLDRAAFKQVIREQAFRATTLHELGHNMGLRHNFIASFDRANFFPEYYEIKKQVAEELGPEPEFVPFQENDETPEEFSERYAAWDTRRQARLARETELGIRNYRYSSIMDYSGLLYNDWNGLGSYDKAAMRFLHAGLVDQSECEGGIDRCATAQRTHVKWYQGGELCEANGDCPHAGDGQTCRRDERITGNLGVSICSNWDDDQRAKGKFNPRQAFCTDDRVADQPFCNRFDEGESSEEIVRNMIETYERLFVFNNFRRYRKAFSVSGYLNRIYGRYFVVIGDQMQALLYKYFYEPGFRTNTGPGGFYDMFRATVLGFDFLGNVMAQPESGSFRWNEDTEMFEQLSDDLVENPNRETINIPLGLGKPLYSSYEDGYFGEVQRLAYVGTFYDKIAALRVLTSRDFGQSNLPNDERFYLSFHDFFPNAFKDLLGAFISGQVSAPAQVYDPETRTIQARTFWDGSFFGSDDTFDPRALNPEGQRVAPGASTQLFIYSLLYSAIYTPYYLDLSYTNAIRVFELGGQTGFSIEGLDGQDYEMCESPLTHRRFVAVRTELTDSIAIQAVERCQALVADYTLFSTAIETGNLPEGRTRAETEDALRSTRNLLENQEDRMSNMVYISDLMGIGSL